MKISLFLVALGLVLSEAATTRDNQTRQVLGEDRFLEYKYSGDFERNSLKKIAQQFNLPMTDSFRVFEIRNVAQEEAAGLRQDKTLTAQQLKELLNNVRTTTEAELARLIGRLALEPTLRMAAGSRT